MDAENTHLNSINSTKQHRARLKIEGEFAR